jgi:hypothetical protein
LRVPGVYARHDDYVFLLEIKSCCNCWVRKFKKQQCYSSVVRPQTQIPNAGPTEATCLISTATRFHLAIYTLCPRKSVARKPCLSHKRASRVTLFLGRSSTSYLCPVDPLSLSRICRSQMGIRSVRSLLSESSLEACALSSPSRTRVPPSYSRDATASPAYLSLSLTSSTTIGGRRSSLVAHLGVSHNPLP